MSSITDLIRKEIENLSTDATRTNVGTIATLADGVARVEGLSKVMYNEMVEFPGNVLGIALNLEEDSVGCVILGETSALKEGDEVRTTGKLLSGPCGQRTFRTCCRCSGQTH
jgi:F-type H+-transporting ATPase subunit alpha